MPIRHTMLGLLSWNPMHGYLLRQFAGEYAWIYPMSNTNIYPALHSLEQDGFVTHESEIHNGRARKVYSITEAGRGELDRWLAEETAQNLTYRDQVLLKIAMLRDESVERAEPWLRHAAQELVREIHAQELELKGHEMQEYTRVVMEHGIDLLRLRLGFLQRVLERAPLASS